MKQLSNLKMNENLLVLLRRQHCPEAALHQGVIQATAAVPIPPPIPRIESWLIAKVKVKPKVGSSQKWKWNLESWLSVKVKPTQETRAYHCSCSCQNSSNNADVFNCNKKLLISTTTVRLLPGQASLAQVEKGGSWRVVQFNNSGDNDGTPIGLQQHTL